MEPPFGDSPTIPMLPPRDGAPQQPPIYQYPPQPQYAQQYPPAPVWPPAQPQQAPYVRQPAAGRQVGAQAGIRPAPRMPHIQARALAGRLKRWSIGLAVAAFVAFVGLAAGHVTGVTAAQAGSSSSSSNNASQQNNDDGGGFFGGQHNNGNNGGGFFGSGGSGSSPSSGTGAS